MGCLGAIYEKRRKDGRDTVGRFVRIWLVFCGWTRLFSALWQRLRVAERRKTMQDEIMAKRAFWPQYAPCPECGIECGEDDLADFGGMCEDCFEDECGRR